MKDYPLRGEEGFSLIELSLVIVVMAILAAFVGVGVNSINTIKLNNAAAKMAGDLRYAQQLAMATRNRHGMTIRSAQIYSLHVNGVAPPLCDGETCISDPTDLGQNFVVDFDAYQQGQLSGVRFNSTAPFCAGPPGCAACGSVIEFDGLGAPTDTSGAPLCDATITLTKSGAANQTITIAANTGKITY